MSSRVITYTFEPAPVPLLKEAPPVYCSECKIPDDHSWWCGVGGAEIAAGSRRYFWRD